MPRPLQEKKNRLIDEYFPWGEAGFPPAPAPGEPAAREQAVRQWLEEQTRDFSNAALTLIARIQPVLLEIQDQFSALEGRRLLARVDSTALVKTPESILEKMVRNWDPDGNSPPDLAFGNFRESMTDLGRFRIVANFLGDAERIARALEAPYGSPKNPLSLAQRELKGEYALSGNKLEDSIHLLPGARLAGERCRKGVFHPRKRHIQHLNVEVQVQTLLQEAWDKKDHFLVYEPRRRGEKLQHRHLCEIFAMSELLYVADITFDRLRQDILGSRLR